MKIILIIVSGLLMVAGFFGCQPTLIAEFQDKAVVEGYLYAGTSPEVKVSKLIAFRDDVQRTDIDIDRLALTVEDISTGGSWLLNSAGDGVYVNDGWTVEEGHSYRLGFNYGDFAVEAVTGVPSKPVGMGVSNWTMYVMRMGGGGMPGSRADDDDDDDDTSTQYPMEITVEWENEDDSYYMVVVECTESNPTPIMSFDDDEDRPGFAFRMEPVRSNTTTLSQNDFSYLGRHDVILVKMQPEYVLLYQYQDSETQTLAEIHANVENGYGIFTGLNTDTLQVRVRQLSF